MGAISLYATALVAKDSRRVVSVRRAPDEGPLGTAVRTFTGSLLGLLGGPVGLVVATSVGTVSGVLVDMARVGVNEEFLAEVCHQLRPGTVALIAEASEEQVTPVDASIATLGGRVIRRARVRVIDAQVAWEVSSLQAELASLKAEFALAAAGDRARLEAHMTRTKATLRAAQERAKAVLEMTAKEADAKVAAVRAKVAGARPDTRARLEARIADIRSDFRRRAERFRRASARNKGELEAQP
ncbi:MAG TPA: DUF1269 domain-containing protein [Anaeromyxobacteraceae bacterium]|nr:DUF1269 domain-containing protein [Anaeromyxobacteraceae bacterium]